MSQLTRALELRRKGQEAVTRAMKDRYGKEGVPICWTRHGMHSGVVVLPGLSDRVKVRNERTGKEFWIYAHDIDES